MYQRNSLEQLLKKTVEYLVYSELILLAAVGSVILSVADTCTAGVVAFVDTVCTDDSWDI